MFRVVWVALALVSSAMSVGIPRSEAQHVPSSIDGDFVSEFAAQNPMARSDALVDARRHYRRERIGFFTSVASLPLFASGLLLFFAERDAGWVEDGLEPPRSYRVRVGFSYALMGLGGGGVLGGHFVGVTNAFRLGRTFHALGGRRMRWAPALAVALIGTGVVSPTMFVPMAIHVPLAGRELARLGGEAPAVQLALRPVADRARGTYGLYVFGSF